MIIMIVIDIYLCINTSHESVSTNWDMKMVEIFGNFDT